MRKELFNCDLCKKEIFPLGNDDTESKDNTLYHLDVGNRKREEVKFGYDFCKVCLCDNGGNIGRVIFGKRI